MYLERKIDELALLKCDLYRVMNENPLLGITIVLQDEEPARTGKGAR
jgi:hypothetical protein